MRFSVKEMKIIAVAKKLGPLSKLETKGQEIEKADNFLYLGIEVSKEANVENEIERRTSMAGIFSRLREKVFKRHDMKLKTNPKLLYSTSAYLWIRNMECNRRYGGEKDLYMRKQLALKNAKNHLQRPHNK